MLDLLTDLMAVADGRCTYAEARHVDTRAETLAVRGGRIDTIDATTSEGIGVRVRVGGAWGFAATDRLDREGAEAALAQALAIAQAQPAAATTALAPVAPARGHWSSAYEVDPFSVGLEEKLALLFAAEEALHTGDARLVRTEASARAWRERKAFASTEGAACTQEQVACGAGIAAYASDGADVQVRSYPLSHGGFFAAAGWEHVDRLALTDQGARVAAEAVELLSAPRVPRGAPDDRAARRAGRAAGARVDRPRARARPHPARRGLLRGHELGGAGRHRRRPALRLGAPERHGRRDAAGRPGLVRMGRRGRARDPHPAHRARRAARRAVEPRERRRARPRAPPAAAPAPTGSPASRSCA